MVIVVIVKDGGGCNDLRNRGDSPRPVEAYVSLVRCRQLGAHESYSPSLPLCVCGALCSDGMCE